MPYARQPTSVSASPPQVQLELQEGQVPGAADCRAGPQRQRPRRLGAGPRTAHGPAHAPRTHGHAHAESPRPATRHTPTMNDQDRALATHDMHATINDTSGLAARSCILLLTPESTRLRCARRSRAENPPAPNPHPSTALSHRRIPIYWNVNRVDQIMSPAEPGARV